MNDAPIQTHVNSRTWAVLEKARQHCGKVLSEVRAVCDDFLASHNLKAEDVCCIVVGSASGER
jgi:hypothetical protein